MIKQFKKALKENSICEESFTACLKKIYLQDTNSLSQFIQPRVKNISPKNDKQEEEIESYKRIFMEGAQYHRIIIEGGAGTGKSTLTAHLARNWAEIPQGDSPQPPLINYQFLVWIKLREINAFIEENKLLQPRSEELLPIYLISRICKIVPTKVDDDWVRCLASFLENNEEKIMYLVDGLDEINSNNNNNDSFTDWLENRGHIIFTSRPIALSFIPPSFTRYSLLEFTDDDRHVFITNYFKNVKSFPQSLDPISIIDNLISVNRFMKSIISVPIQLFNICEFIKRITESCRHENLNEEQLVGKIQSKNITTFYSKLIDSTLENNATRLKLNISHIEEDTKLAAGSLAMEGLCTYQTIFTIDTLRRHCNSRGINKDNEKVKLIIGGLMKGFGVTSSEYVGRGEFIHKTFQEYLAAYYFVHAFCNSISHHPGWISDFKPLNQQLPIYIDKEDKHIKVSSFMMHWNFKYGSNFKLFWRFVAGLMIDHRLRKSEGSKEHFDFFGKVIQSSPYYTLRNNVLLTCIDEMIVHSQSSVPILPEEFLDDFNDFILHPDQFFQRISQISRYLALYHPDENVRKRMEKINKININNYIFEEFNGSTNNNIVEEFNSSAMKIQTLRKYCLSYTKEVYQLIKCAGKELIENNKEDDEDENSKLSNDRKEDCLIKFISYITHLEEFNALQWEKQRSVLTALKHSNLYLILMKLLEPEMLKYIVKLLIERDEFKSLYHRLLHRLLLKMPISDYLLFIQQLEMIAKPKEGEEIKMRIQEIPNAEIPQSNTLLFNDYILYTIVYVPRNEELLLHGYRFIDKIEKEKEEFEGVWKCWEAGDFSTHFLPPPFIFREIIHIAVHYQLLDPALLLKAFLQSIRNNPFEIGVRTDELSIALEEIDREKDKNRFAEFFNDCKMLLAENNSDMTNTLFSQLSRFFTDKYPYNYSAFGAQFLGLLIDNYSEETRKFIIRIFKSYQECIFIGDHHSISTLISYIHSPVIQALKSIINEREYQMTPQLEGMIQSDDHKQLYQHFGVIAFPNKGVGDLPEILSHLDYSSPAFNYLSYHVIKSWSDTRLVVSDFRYKAPGDKDIGCIRKLETYKISKRTEEIAMGQVNKVAEYHQKVYKEIEENEKSLKGWNGRQWRPAFILHLYRNCHNEEEKIKIHNACMEFINNTISYSDLTSIDEWMKMNKVIEMELMRKYLNDRIFANLSTEILKKINDLLDQVKTSIDQNGTIGGVDVIRYLRLANHLIYSISSNSSLSFNFADGLTEKINELKSMMKKGKKALQYFLLEQLHQSINSISLLRTSEQTSQAKWEIAKSVGKLGIVTVSITATVIGVAIAVGAGGGATFGVVAILGAVAAVGTGAIAILGFLPTIKSAIESIYNNGKILTDSSPDGKTNGEKRTDGDEFELGEILETLKKLESMDQNQVGQIMGALRSGNINSDNDFSPQWVNVLNQCLTSFNRLLLEKKSKLSEFQIMSMINFITETRLRITTLIDNGLDGEIIELLKAAFRYPLKGQRLLRHFILFSVCKLRKETNKEIFPNDKSSAFALFYPSFTLPAPSPPLQISENIIIIDQNNNNHFDNSEIIILDDKKEKKQNKIKRAKEKIKGWSKESEGKEERKKEKADKKNIKKCSKAQKEFNSLWNDYQSGTAKEYVENNSELVPTSDDHPFNRRWEECWDRQFNGDAVALHAIQCFYKSKEKDDPMERKKYIEKMELSMSEVIKSECSSNVLQQYNCLEKIYKLTYLHKYLEPAYN